MRDMVTADQWASGSWSHSEIMDVVARLSPCAIEKLARDWKSIVADTDSALSSFHRDMAATILADWEGRAAHQVRETMRTYVTGARSILSVALGLSDNLHILASAAAEVQSAIAEPPGRDAFDAYAAVSGPGLFVASEAASWEQAVHQVRTLYSDPAVRAGNAVPILEGLPQTLGSPTRVYEPVFGHPVVDEQVSRAAQFLAQLGRSTGEPKTETDPVGNGPTESLPVHGGRDTRAPGDLDVGGFEDPNVETDRLPAAAQRLGIPAGQVDPYAYRSGPDSSRGGPSATELAEDDVYARQNWLRDPLRDKTHEASVDLPGTASGSGQLLSPDRLPTGAAPAAPAAGAVGGLAMRSVPAPAMGAMGMYPPMGGARRPDRDDNEHFIPRYLVNRDNTDALIGRLPKATVPVIGVWD